MNDTLQLLGMALGLGALAGLNLYLTVFVTGLAINQHWIELAERYQSIEVLGHPAIIITAGVLYFLEFFADKIPWVDSLWDSLHTIIRPIGAAFIAIQVLGETDEVFQIVISLLAGGTALLTHSVKASTRLVVNASPEPFSNIALSVAEDATVLGGLALIHFNPVIALLVLLASLGALFFFLPRMFRSARARTWLIWRKLTAPAAGDKRVDLSSNLPAEFDMAFSHHTIMQETVAWGAPCLTGPGRQLAPNQFGYLVASREEPKKIHFLAKRGMNRNSRCIEISGFRVAHEPRFLSENVVLYKPESREKYTFLFNRSQSGLAHLVVEALKAQINTRELSAKIATLSPDEMESEAPVDSVQAKDAVETGKLQVVND
jgi:hypothetical protein